MKQKAVPFILFEVFTRDGKVYEVWSNGRTVGFPEDSGICNWFRGVLRQAIALNDFSPLLGLPRGSNHAPIHKESVREMVASQEFGMFPLPESNEKEQNDQNA